MRRVHSFAIPLTGQCSEADSQRTDQAQLPANGSSQVSRSMHTVHTCTCVKATQNYKIKFALLLASSSSALILNTLLIGYNSFHTAP